MRSAVIFFGKTFRISMWFNFNFVFIIIKNILQKSKIVNRSVGICQINENPLQIGGGFIPVEASRTFIDLCLMIIIF